MTTLQESIERARSTAMSQAAKARIPECGEFAAIAQDLDFVCAALAQQGEQAKPVAYITDTHQGPMVWTPEMYDEACTYCDDGEFPVPLYTAAPAPQTAQELTGCACRWDADDNRVATCVRHQGWLDVVGEWAERAKAADAALQSAQPVAQPLTLEQILDIVKKLDETPDMSHVDVLKTFARAIEAAHGIREVK